MINVYITEEMYKRAKKNRNRSPRRDITHYFCECGTILPNQEHTFCKKCELRREKTNRQIIQRQAMREMARLYKAAKNERNQTAEIKRKFSRYKDD